MKARLVHLQAHMRKPCDGEIIIDDETGKMLGVHLISHEANEVFNHVATAIQFDLAVRGLKQIIYAYPTAASIWGYRL